MKLIRGFLLIASIASVFSPAFAYSSRNRTIDAVSSASTQEEVYETLPQPTSICNPFPTANRTRDEIIARWRQLRPVYTGSPYAVMPSIRAPYSAGKLADGFVRDGLNMLNFVRYLAGLTSDIGLNDTYTSYAQQGMVLLAAVNKVAHHVDRPTDMPEDFYTIANIGTAGSDINWGRTTLHEAILKFMWDSDVSNLPKLGHRLLILNAALNSTGFGYYEKFNAVYVIDQNPRRFSLVWNDSYDYLSWPAAGFFPSEFFDKTAAWSIMLQPGARFYYGSPSDYKVTLTRLNDGKVWTLDASDGTPTAEGEYFTFSEKGGKYTLIFRPDAASADYNAGMKYKVSIEGLKYASGDNATLNFTVEFFSLGS